MPPRVRHTRLELKRTRDALARYERYLPMLKLKKQLLQAEMERVRRDYEAAVAQTRAAEAVYDVYKIVRAGRAGVNLDALARPEEIRTGTMNIAGVEIPMFDSVRFAESGYPLFATPPWVDRALHDLRAIAECQARETILQRQNTLLRHELTRVTQRVNLFEKVKIPQARETIRRIRIALGDLMTAAVGCAKIAKSKLAAAAEHAEQAP